MIKAVIFDMFETLITLYNSELYKGRQIAEEMGISEAKFREIWDTSDEDRTLGVRTFEEVIIEILQANNIYSKDLYETIVNKRYYCTAETFNNMHPEVVLLFGALKERGIKIGLITNCYNEEREVIKKSEIYKYFDAACMSCDIGIKKPNPKIYEICVEKLEVEPEECIYVGDGGSHELEAALECGMKAIQATWYLKEGVDQPCGKLEQFQQAANPLEIIKMANSLPL